MHATNFKQEKQQTTTSNQAQEMQPFIQIGHDNTSSTLGGLATIRCDRQPK